MQRKVLVATVATAPLLAMALAVHAETIVNTARTTPIATSTAASGAADDVKIDAAGSVKLTTAGALVTLDSNNKVTNLGVLSSTGVNASIGVLVLGGRAGTVTNSAAISLVEDYTAVDSDSDGDLDGAFALGQNRYGVRLTGPGAFTGNIVQDSTGSITIEGNNSAGLSLESALIGNLTTAGSILVTGDNSYGLRVAGPVTGAVTSNGSIGVLGGQSVGLAVDGNVSGAIAIQSAVTATGYRYTSRPSTLTALTALDVDDKLQGGPAVRIGGNVGGGLLLSGPNISTSVGANGVTTTTTNSSSTTGTSSISTFGGAPALLIGSATQSVTLGAVGAADNAYGLVARGAISAAGVYDGITATAVQIGVSAANATTMAGGLRNDGSIAANSYEADATGLRLTAGALVPAIVNRGTIIGSSASYAASGLTGNALGLLIESGASVTSLSNSGSIHAARTGQTGDAVAIRDLSGTLRTLTNTGSIQAALAAPAYKLDGTTATTTAAGKAIALDLRAATAGVTVNQTAPTSWTSTSTYPAADTVTTGSSTATTNAPTIVGQVLFGSGADTLNVSSGTVFGDIAFGAGADTLAIGGGAIVIGALTDTDGQLAINLGQGALSLTNAQTINATSLNVGSTSKLVFTADPTAGTNTRIVVSGAANLASGAQLGLNLTTLVKAPTSFAVITAGSLTSGVLSQDLLGNAPYLYVAGSHTDAHNVYIDVRRRSAAEIGMSTSQASAYDAVFAALGGNSDLTNAFLSRNDRDGFLGYYNQLLPDQGEGLFSALQSVGQQISAATAVRPDPGDRYGPDSLWIQEINTLIRRDTADTMGSDTQAFGFVGGYEAMGEAGGALGLTLAYVSVEEHDIAAKVGEQTTGNFVQLGGYWRRSIGGWRMNAGGGGGFGWYDGDRTFSSGDLNNDGANDVIRHNSAKWTGYTFNAFAGTAYEAKFGRYYARPEARLDYLYLQEGARNEKGGSDTTTPNAPNAIDQNRAKRKSDSLTGDVGVAFGADFGRDMWWRPEVRVGYRQTLAGKIGDTTFSYASGGNPVTLAAMNNKDGAVTLGLALRAGTPMSYLALEANAEAAKKQKRYNLKLTGRAMF